MYVLSSPERLFLWVGSDVVEDLQKGSLHILRTFAAAFS